MKKYLWTILSIVSIFVEMNVLWWVLDQYHNSIFWNNVILAVFLFGGLGSAFCVIKSMNSWSDYFDTR